MEQSLFKLDKLRLANGRFCTDEQYSLEQAKRENVVLRMERDKYYRMAMALGRENSRLLRELAIIKSKIGDIL